MNICTIVTVLDKKLLSDISYLYLDGNDNKIIEAEKIYLRKISNKENPTYRIGDTAIDDNNMVEELKSKGVKKIKISYTINNCINYLLVVDINIKDNIIFLPSFYMNKIYNIDFYNEKFENLINRKDIKYVIGRNSEKEEKIEYTLTNCTMVDFLQNEILRESTFFKVIKKKITLFEHYFISEK